MRAESRGPAPIEREVGGGETDLRTLLALHAIALGTMSHGLCLFDAEDRVVLFNKRYLEIINLASDVVRPGMSFRTVLELGAERGHFSPATLDQIWRERRREIQDPVCPPDLCQRTGATEIAAGNFVAAGGSEQRWIYLPESRGHQSGIFRRSGRPSGARQPADIV